MNDRNLRTTHDVHWFIDINYDVLVFILLWNCFVVNVINIKLGPLEAVRTTG